MSTVESLIRLLCLSERKAMCHHHLWMQVPAHKMFDQVDFHEKELLPFYDLHLKGKNNGFMAAEPVRLFVRGANVWRAEQQWPP